MTQQQEAAREIERHVIQALALAKRHRGLKFLAYLLGMAALQAARDQMPEAQKRGRV